MNDSWFAGSSEGEAAENQTTRPATTSPQLLVLRFVCEVVITAPIVLVGVIANVIAFVVLCRQKQRLTTTVLLQAITVADTLILVCALLLRCLLHFHIQTDLLKNYAEVYKYVFIYLFPVVYFIRLVATWLTTLLTIDRYIVVCHPLQAQRLCTLSRAYKNMAAVTVFAFLFSLPRFFENRLDDANPIGFSTTALVQNQAYTVIYRISLFTIFMYLMPISILVVLNTRLLMALRSANRMRWALGITRGGRSGGGGGSGGSQQPSHNKSITVIVVTVVLITIVCNTSALVAHLLWSLHKCFARLRHLDEARRWVAHVSNVMITINCGVNFAIYCLCSRNFRAELRRLFRSRCCDAYAEKRQRMRDRKTSLSSNERTYITLATHAQQCRMCGGRDATPCGTCSRRFTGRPCQRYTKC